MKSHFSPLLLDEIRKSLSRKQQIILFQNRRGFSNYLECMSCGWIPVCRACDVSLTYHKESNRLICHYCGHSSPIPHSCGECQGTEIRTRGFGTEKVAEEFSIFFPESRLIRFDLDAAKSRKQYESIIRDFEEGKTDVLVGTQIISKGLDFENVGLVGILNADNLLKFPDFRAYERSYQLMAQVAGRAGRKKKKGLVVIQTSDPGNEVINNVMNNDYKNIYSQQIAERKKFNYPPFSRLLRISIRHRNKGMLETASSLIASDLKNIQGILVLGPQAPLISRIKGSYIKDILIKIPRSPKLAVYKETIRNLLEEYTGHTTYRGLQVIVDVDP